MGSQRFFAFAFVSFLSAMPWITEEILFWNIGRDVLGRADSVTLTLLIWSILAASFNLFARYSFVFLLVPVAATLFTYTSYKYYLFYEGFISHAQLALLPDLLASVEHLPLIPFAILVTIGAFITAAGWTIYRRHEPLHKELSYTRRWMPPLFAASVAAAIFVIHQSKISMPRENAFPRNLAYDYSLESPAMFFFRSLPIVQYFSSDKASLRARANLSILAAAIRKGKTVKLPDEYLYTNFDDLIPPYSGHIHAKQELDPFLFLPEQKNNQPAEMGDQNVILVVMESLRAYDTSLFGNEHSLTPNLDDIAAQSLSASTFYSTGRHTIKSEQAILCSALDSTGGAPYSTARGAFKGECLPRILSKHGYETYWFHGNTKTFYNRTAFHPSIGFEHLYGKEEFVRDGYDEQRDVGWGVPDTVLFEQALEKLKKVKQPFFAEILTLTNHYPFNWNYPELNNTRYPDNEDDDTHATEFKKNHKKGIRYADYAIGQFWSLFKSSKLANNTILLITADHGISGYFGRPRSAFEKHEILFRVPLIVAHPSVKPASVSEPLSHLDIAPTILSLLEIESPVSFMGRPFLGIDATMATRPIFTMDLAHFGFRYGTMYCLPFEDTCSSQNGRCVRLSDHFCSYQNERDLTAFRQAANLLNYLNLAWETGYVRPVNQHNGVEQ